MRTSSAITSTFSGACRSVFRRCLAKQHETANCSTSIYRLVFIQTAMTSGVIEMLFVREADGGAPGSDVHEGTELGVPSSAPG